MFDGVLSLSERKTLASNLLDRFCSNFQNLHKICILGQSARQVMLNNIKSNISFWPKSSKFFIRCTIFKVYLKYIFSSVGPI